MAVIIGSARIDENGKAHGGKAGDQTGKEVSTQNWYKHSKGWVVLRAKDPKKAAKIAQAMRAACDNPNIGYDQYQNQTLWDEVKDRLNKSALGLSGGQQQRLCIARALAVEPEVILMDEPTSALDPISTSKIEDLAIELKEKYTIIIVTHNMQQAARISDKTAFFLLGDMVEFDSTEKLFSVPKDKRTEDYITGRFG